MTAHDDRRAAYEERAARLYPDNDTTYGPYAVQEAYVDGALYSNPGVPRVIRTREELAALDPDTMLVSTVETQSAFAAEEPHKLAAPGRWIEIGWLPAVVIATGDQIRAARQALEEA